MTQTYVINLDRSTERMAHMAELLSAQGLEFIRIPAVDDKMQGPHVSCFLSHIKVWETFLASDHDYALVLEDDVLMAVTAHLGYEEGKEAPAGQTNRRTGVSTRVLRGRC